MKDNRLIIGILVTGLFFSPITSLFGTSTDIGSLHAEEQLSADSPPAKLKAKLAEIDKRINESPSAKLYAAKANVLAFQDDYKSALQAINKAISLSPHNGEYHAYKGLLYATIGNADETIKSIEKAKSYGITDPDYFGTLALAQAGKQDNKNALKNIELALKIDPKNFSALHARARVRTNLKEYQRAVSDFTLAIRQKDYLPEIYRERSLVLAKLGRKKEAEADISFAKELKLQPKR